MLKRLNANSCLALLVITNLVNAAPAKIQIHKKGGVFSSHQRVAIVSVGVAVIIATAAGVAIKTNLDKIAEDKATEIKNQTVDFDNFSKLLDIDLDDAKNQFSDILKLYYKNDDLAAAELCISRKWDSHRLKSYREQLFKLAADTKLKFSKIEYAKLQSVLNKIYNFDEKVLIPLYIWLYHSDFGGLAYRIAKTNKDYGDALLYVKTHNLGMATAFCRDRFGADNITFDNHPALHITHLAGAIQSLTGDRYRVMHARQYPTEQDHAISIQDHAERIKKLTQQADTLLNDLYVLLNIVKDL